MLSCYPSSMGFALNVTALAFTQFKSSWLIVLCLFILVNLALFKMSTKLYSAEIIK